MFTILELVIPGSTITFVVHVFTTVTSKTEKMRLLLIPALSLLFVMACTPSQKESGQAHVQHHHVEHKQEADADAAPAAAVVSTDQPIQEQTGSAVLLNPPHGQPGHLCEIPVGSPLPTAGPATIVADNPAVSSAGNMVSSQSLTAQTGSAVLLNPPHGQPGHLCEIPVGSPLPTAGPATRLSDNPTAPTIENAARLYPRRVQRTSSTPRLNPPHGQPGHRCEIPVGSPLN